MEAGGVGTLKDRVEAKKAGPAVGDLVKLTKPGVNGRVNIAGTVSAILPDGRLEIRTQNDGTMKVKPEDLGHKPKPAAVERETQPAATTATPEVTAPTAPAAPVTPQDQAGTPAEGAGASRPTPAAPTQATSAQQARDALIPNTENPHEKSGAAHFAAGKPRTVPPEISKPENIAAWHRGYDAAKAAASPNSAESKPNSATPAPKPDKPKRPPKSFRTKQMVTTTVLVEETGKFEQREIDAESAMVALDADIAELEAFMKCLKG